MKRKQSTESNRSRKRRVDPPLTADQLADCRTLARLFYARKQETKAQDGPTWSFAYLEKKTSISQSSWGLYVRLQRPMTINAMTQVERIYGYPKENFRCWPRTSAPKDETPILASIAELPAEERTAITDVLRQMLRAPRNRRVKVLQSMRRMLGASGKIALVKASTA